MRTTNWNFGPTIPLAPITVYEPAERTAHSGLLGPDGQEITWVLDEPVVGFTSPAEQRERLMLEAENEGHPAFDGEDEDTDPDGIPTVPIWCCEVAEWSLSRRDAVAMDGSMWERKRLWLHNTRRCRSRKD